MITISLCMIVKNEEKTLSRCLDSIASLMDELIIVDTGSTDHTKEIAQHYTNQVYDFSWNGNFSDARNFSFSKASMDYIYAPDADEMLDEINQLRFAQLKETLLPEIEIVQMKYHTISEFDTVLNAKKEYRPKLFKRLRTFSWENPIHETVRIMPIVYDSEIEILHMPQSMHSKRDFSIFQNTLLHEGALSPKIQKMYAKELLKTGDETDFLAAEDFFVSVYENDTSEDARKDAACVLARLYRLLKKQNEFFKLTLKDMITTPCAEICYELGCYFQSANDYQEAILWYYNAAFETESLLDIHTSGDLPLKGLVDCYDGLIADLTTSSSDAGTSTSDSVLEEIARNSMLDAYKSELENYHKKLAAWELPEEF